MGQLSSLVNIVRLFNEAVEEIRDAGPSTYAGSVIKDNELPTARMDFKNPASGEVCNQLYRMLVALRDTGHAKEIDFRHMQRPHSNYPERYLFTLKTPDFAERVATRSQTHEGDFKIYLSCFDDGRHSLRIHGCNDRATRGLRDYLRTAGRSNENRFKDMIVLSRRDFGGLGETFSSLEDPKAGQVLKEVARVLIYGAQSLSLFCESRRARSQSDPHPPKV